MRKLILAALAALLIATPALADGDTDAIRALLHGTFDKPEARLAVEPIVVAHDYAVAGWTQGDMGGRALLGNRHGKWVLILCSGDGIKSADALRHAGMPAQAAETLAGKLAEAESRVSPERLALFAKFEGLVMMDAAGHHPPVQHQKH